jgi:hypothetical protein
MLYHVVVYVPLSHANAVREAVAKAGAGKIGNYEACSFSERGVGRFRPIKGAQPMVGSVGRLEEVEEERIEFMVEEQRLGGVVTAARNAHPYEEPAIHLWKMEDYKTHVK